MEAWKVVVWARLRTRICPVTTLGFECCQCHGELTNSIMVGSHAERQLHIHSISISNEEVDEAELNES